MFAYQIKDYISFDRTHTHLTASEIFLQNRILRKEKARTRIASTQNEQSKTSNYETVASKTTRTKHSNSRNRDSRDKYIHGL